MDTPYIPPHSFIPYIERVIGPIIPRKVHRLPSGSWWDEGAGVGLQDDESGDEGDGGDSDSSGAGVGDGENEDIGDNGEE